MMISAEEFVRQARRAGFYVTCEEDYLILNQRFNVDDDYSIRQGELIGKTILELVEISQAKQGVPNKVIMQRVQNAGFQHLQLARPWVDPSFMGLVRPLAKAANGELERNKTLDQLFEEMLEDRLARDPELIVMLENLAETEVSLEAQKAAIEARRAQIRTEGQEARVPKRSGAENQGL